MSAYQPIACHKHDYLEIACLKAYRLELLLISGERIKGVAKTTSSQNQQEFLLFETNSNSEQMIRLDHIKVLSVLNNNADFQTIQFIGTD